mgnify:CR=1 FL=1
MTLSQNDLNRAVARATGETVSEIARRGFQPLELEPSEPEDVIVDWDQVELDRHVSVVDHHARRVA